MWRKWNEKKKGEQGKGEKRLNACVCVCVEKVKFGVRCRGKNKKSERI